MTKYNIHSMTTYIRDRCIKHDIKHISKEFCKNVNIKLFGISTHTSDVRCCSPVHPQHILIIYIYTTLGNTAKLQVIVQKIELMCCTRGILGRFEGDMIQHGER